MGLHQVENLLEAVGAAVVRVGYVAGCGEQADLRALPGCGHALQLAQMPAVHRQDQVELVEIPRPDLSRALRTEVVAPIPGVVLRALVGRLADVPVAEPGGFDAQRDACPSAETPENPFCRGRAADISRADE